MLSGADLRQALQAGLWEALADDSDRAALRATCRDARDMADALHDTAVLPVGPGTWDSAATIATYHRRLSAVRSVHVVYSGGAEDEARAVHFMEAYSTELGAALPAADCSITMAPHRQLPAPLAAALLQRVVPHVERLDMPLGYRVGQAASTVQVLQALEPCARLCSLRFHEMHAAEEPDLDDEDDVALSFENHPGPLEALCRLTRLHTLSGPWVIKVPHLQRLCNALPSLTTLGFVCLNLNDAPGTCISRQLHTLAGWRYSEGHESLRLDRPWHLQGSTVAAPHNLQAALPAVRHLDALVLRARGPQTADLPAMQAVIQRFAACADSWAWEVAFDQSAELQGLRGMAPGSLAALKHLDVSLNMEEDGLDLYLDVALGDLAPADVASTLSSLVSAAPNITTLVMSWAWRAHEFAVPSPQELAAMMQPFRRAAHLHTLWLHEDEYHGTLSTAAQQAALLEGVARCLAQPGAGGGDEYCRALRHVLLAGAQPDALAACRAALARDGICVAVDSCDAW